LDGTVWNRERVAFRQHFAVRPASEYVQVVWGAARQCYITPVGAEEISVAVIASGQTTNYRELLACFPTVEGGLHGAATSTSVRGCLTASRRLRRVGTGQVALVGDASGSVDAITGEGICIALQQAEAVANAMQAGDLDGYKRQHRTIMRRASVMAGVLCSLSAHDGLRRRVIHRLSQDPELFERILGLHVGATGVRKLGLLPSFKLGAALLPLPAESVAKRR
jgi:flavin-dependent dehydrogenase